MLSVDPAQIRAQALNRLRKAAKRSDIEFQILVTSRPVPNKYLAIGLVLAAAAAAWYVPAALGLDLTLDITSRRLRHAPTALLAIAFVAPLVLTRTWSLGFCSDGSVVVARNGFAQGVNVLQTLRRPEIVLEETPPLWRPPRIGVGEWVWQVHYNDVIDPLPNWLCRRQGLPHPARAT